MRKEEGWQWYPSIGLPSSNSRCDFQTNRCKPHSVSGLKLPQRTLFMSFAINNCFPTSDEKLLAVFELILGIFFYCLFICLVHFFKCIPDHYHEAEVTAAMLPISMGYLCRNTIRRADFLHYLKRIKWWIADSYRLLKYRGVCTIQLFQLSLWCEN